MTYVVHDDWEWKQYDTLSAALEEAQRCFRAGSEDVTLYEEVNWVNLLPPDLRPGKSPVTKEAADTEGQEWSDAGLRQAEDRWAGEKYETNPGEA